MLHLGGGLFTCAKGDYYRRGFRRLHIEWSIFLLLHNVLQNSYELDRAAEKFLTRSHIIAIHRPGPSRALGEA